MMINAKESDSTLGNFRCLSVPTNQYLSIGSSSVKHSDFSDFYSPSFYYFFIIIIIITILLLLTAHIIRHHKRADVSAFAHFFLQHTSKLQSKFNIYFVIFRIRRNIFFFAACNIFTYFKLLFPFKTYFFFISA